MKNTIVKTNIFNINDNVISLDEISFAIRNKLLENSTFKLKNRKEKSIIKVIYEEYFKFNRHDKKRFLEYMDDIVNNIIDPNFAVILLKSINKNNILNFFHKDKYSLSNCILILKGYRYSERQITDFISDIVSYSFSFYKDIFDNLDFIKEHNYIEEFKSKCAPRALYDKSTNRTQDIIHELIKDNQLNYRDEHKEYCINYNGYEIKLAYNGDELVRYARYLNNCIASYYDKIQRGKCQIYFFFKDNILLFAVRVYEKTILEVSAKNNKPIKSDEEYVLNQWMNHFSIK